LGLWFANHIIRPSVRPDLAFDPRNLCAQCLHHSRCQGGRVRAELYGPPPAWAVSDAARVARAASPRRTSRTRRPRREWFGAICVRTIRYRAASRAGRIRTGDLL